MDDHWYPSDSKQQAKVDEYLEWAHLNTRLNCSAYFVAKVTNLLCVSKIYSTRRIFKHIFKYLNAFFVVP